MAKRKKSAAVSLVISLVMGLFAGCGTTIGPKVETRYVRVMPGVPIVVLENVVVRGRALTDTAGAAVPVDIGGWVAMPLLHWEQVRRDLISRGSGRE